MGPSEHSQGGHLHWTRVGNVDFAGLVAFLNLRPMLDYPTVEYFLRNEAKCRAAEAKPGAIVVDRSFTP